MALNEDKLLRFLIIDRGKPTPNASNVIRIALTVQVTW